MLTYQYILSSSRKKAIGLVLAKRTVEGRAISLRRDCVLQAEQIANALQGLSRAFGASTAPRDGPSWSPGSSSGSDAGVSDAEVMQLLRMLQGLHTSAANVGPGGILQGPAGLHDSTDVDSFRPQAAAASAQSLAAVVGRADQDASASPQLLDSSTAGTLAELADTAVRPGRPAQTTADAGSQQPLSRPTVQSRQISTGATSRSAVPGSPSDSSGESDDLSDDILQLISQLQGLRGRSGTDAGALQPTGPAEQAQVPALAIASLSREQRRAIRQMTDAASGHQVMPREAV